MKQTAENRARAVPVLRSDSPEPNKASFNARTVCRRSRKTLTLSLLWWRHQAAEPKDPRPYFIALAHCAERPWHLKALIRYANRRWPVMAGELGEGGMLRL